MKKSPCKLVHTYLTEAFSQLSFRPLRWTIASHQVNIKLANIETKKEILASFRSKCPSISFQSLLLRYQVSSTHGVLFHCQALAAILVTLKGNKSLSEFNWGTIHYSLNKLSTLLGLNYLILRVRIVTSAS